MVLAFTPLNEPRVNLTNPPLFRKVVKAAFNQRRKTLRNALRALEVDADMLNQAMLASDIDPVRRGETLTIEEFATLSNTLDSIEAKG